MVVVVAAAAAAAAAAAVVGVGVGVGVGVAANCEKRSRGRVLGLNCAGTKLTKLGPSTFAQLLISLPPSLHLPRCVRSCVRRTAMHT